MRKPHRTAQLLLLQLLIGALPAFGQVSFNNLQEKIAYYKQQCTMNVRYNIQNAFPVECANNYHHYNAKAASFHTFSNGKVRIAQYNLLYAGSKYSQHKDYELLSAIVNRWDVVGAVELSPIVKEDLIANQRIATFIANYKTVLAQRKSQLQTEKSRANPNYDRISKLEQNIKAINDTYKYHRKLYRLPGYLRLLNELRKRDPSWGLILTPIGQAAAENIAQELHGFYYRGKAVRPIINEYCNATKRTGDTFPFACILHMDGRFLGKKLQHVFPRRPFMASFRSGNFDFTLLTAHLRYTRPKDPYLEKAILKSAFNTNSFSNIGIGVNQDTYARFAEAKLTLDFIEKYKKKFKEKDVIYMADFNLSMGNRYWTTLLANYNNQVLNLGKKTTLTWGLTSKNGTPTNGLSNDYDHIITDMYRLKECKNSRGQFNVMALNYFTGATKKIISDRYIVRSETYSGGKFPIVRKSHYKKLMSWKSSEMNNYYMTISRSYEMYRQESQIKHAMNHFQNRVLLSQQNPAHYYRIYSEVISDHLPIYMNCRTDIGDDD
jgi:hypothetical protein